MASSGRKALLQTLERAIEAVRLDHELFGDELSEKRRDGLDLGLRVLENECSLIMQEAVDDGNDS